MSNVKYVQRKVKECAHCEKASIGFFRVTTNNGTRWEYLCKEHLEWTDKEFAIISFEYFKNNQCVLCEHFEKTYSTIAVITYPDPQPEKEMDVGNCILYLRPMGVHMTCNDFEEKSVDRRSTP